MGRFRESFARAKRFPTYSIGDGDYRTPTTHDCSLNHVTSQLNVGSLCLNHKSSDLRDVFSPDPLGQRSLVLVENLRMGLSVKKLKGDTPPLRPWTGPVSQYSCTVGETCGVSGG